MTFKRKFAGISMSMAILAGSMGVGVVAAPAANAAPASQCKTWMEYGGSGYAVCEKGDPYKVEIECRTKGLISGWQHKKVRGAWVTRGNISQAHCPPNWKIFDGRVVVIRS